MDSAQRQALEDCLGVGDGGEVLPIVALGRSDLCLWRNTEHPDQFCAGGTNATCPFVMPDSGNCGASQPSGHEMVVISNDDTMYTEVGEKIGLVASVSPDGEPIDGELTTGVECSPWILADLAILRASTASSEQRGRARQRIRASGFFDYENVRAVAARIGWQGLPENYSRLLVDGAPLRDDSGNVIGTTGNADDGPASRWPCGGTAMVEHLADDDPLTNNPDSGNLAYCGASDPARRAQVNWRLGRAATVLTALLDLGLGNHRLPALYHGTTAADMTEMSYSDAVVNGYSYSVAPSATVDGIDLSGSFYGFRSGNSSSPSDFWRASNNARAVYDAGTSAGADVGVLPSGYYAAYTNATRPFGFLNFGYRVRDDDRVQAGAISRRLWEGVGSVAGDQTSVAPRFFDEIDLDESDLAHIRDEDTRRAAAQRLFNRALIRASDDSSRVYLNNGRGGGGGSDLEYLTHLFNVPNWDLGDGPNDINALSLFPSTDELGGNASLAAGYGPNITRRDLIDAMELACYVSSLDPPPPDMVTDEDRPTVNSPQDAAQVELFAERVATSFDALSRVQVVRDVPRDVIQRLRSENVGNATSEGASTADRVTGQYGQIESGLRQALRTVGESPAQIAASLRRLKTSISIFERRGDIFQAQYSITMLRTLVSVLHSLSACLSAVQGAVNGAGGSGGVATGICAVQGVIGLLEIEIGQRQLFVQSTEFAIEVEQWGEEISSVIDQIDSQRTAYLNAIDQVQALSGQLRDARTESRSALARALFLSSDAADRQFRSNTVMRRLYDINLQRYEEAHRAAVRAAALARFAIEQRFGVDLATQTCSQLVDSPRSWADEVCTTTGINYTNLRDASFDFDEDAIRQMYIGDYVRRLEQYVESYRFDYPFQSGDDLIVMSVRDDLVRAQSACIDPVPNLLGSSNDLLAPILPNADGTPGVEQGWAQRGCSGTAPYANCMQVSEVTGPQYDVSGSADVDPAVFARSDSHRPRGFEIRFAPNPSMGTYTGDYVNGASYVQDIYLAPGTYRLSWYEASGGTVPRPTVEMRAASTTLSASNVIEGTLRPLTSDWGHYYQVIEVPGSAAGEIFSVGVFAEDVSPIEEQAIQVAGLQLELITGSVTDDAWEEYGTAGLEENPPAYGPGLFVSTTAPGYGYVDDCFRSDPNAFRLAWRYDCAELCSGGFSGHCAPGEAPQRFCYWEVPFNLDEDRLLSRGGGFGGGFAFGNYNYRSGDIGVNVVGTGVRRCGEGSLDACASTGAVPFSLIHTPPGPVSISGGSYTIRAHDGTLHSVNLFDGRIESGRALAAERYLSNPLSSADASLINDYMRGELRGRPMTGNYRLIIWDNGDVNFGAIEDVQLLWRYRYFTRTGNAYQCE
ncbi:MAG: hypothetical protein AB7S26_42830 [Sandaracinaceae bacterium]